ncbi:alpha/beta hydrolase [Uruburuella testudinis]|uniref:Alpha/beta hydrolase n=1 Tax=Uruburuella testudinis TaxID=1282863 RepID=A0ABY4DPE7_9NEIS|nr:alpha/beta hydrolase [Uruburuella testudinis]UOO80929.1 alpha/beta hydrolase [Uruburuella testudinis]
MNKLIFSAICAAFSLSVAAQDLKTLHRLAPEYQSTAPQWTADISDDAEVARRNAGFKSAAESGVQPGQKIIVPAADGQPAVDLYVYRPQKAAAVLPVIYFIHGGGYIMGNARQNNAALADLAERNQAAVVSVEYRLATEAPFPADLQDAYHGLSHIYRHAAALGLDASRLILMGESAGGGLAARLALYTRDQGEFTPAGQVLIYPMLDHRTGTDRSPYRNPDAGEFVWTAASNRFGWNKLRGNQRISNAQMPYFSPAAAKNLRGLPPAFIAVGDLDLFVNEDIDYANRLIQAGVPTELHVIPGVFHAFEIIVPDSPQTAQYRELRRNAIQGMLRGAKY